MVEHETFQFVESSQGYDITELIMCTDLLRLHGKSGLLFMNTLFCMLSTEKVTKTQQHKTCIANKTIQRKVHFQAFL